MEKIHEFEKENVIGPIKCSPVLPSVHERSGVRRVDTSPLLVLKDSQLNNIFESPGRAKSPKVQVQRFLSTPSHSPSDCEAATNPWEEIQKLDEEEEWIERTQVVTKEDHILYCEVAKEVINSIMENLPIESMDQNHDDIESANLDLTGKPVETVVSDEKKEDVTTDIKTIALDTDSLHLSDHPLEKSVLEDNDFIHSCSDLDVTVKEILQDEEPISPKKIHDICTDVDADGEITVCPDPEDMANVTVIQSQEFTDPASDNNTTEIQVDEDSFKPTTEEAFALELDYLETIGSSDDAEHTSDLSRQSLYVKFDPLVQSGKSEKDPNNLTNINPADFLFPGPISGSDLLVMDTPPRKPSQSHVPLVSQTSNEEPKSSETTEAAAPVDQLLEFSPAKESTESEKDDAPKYDSIVNEEDSSLVQPLLYSKSDLEKAVAEERKKLMAQWKEETAFHELEIKEQATKMEKLLVEKNKAVAEIHEMKTVMLEYEQTMAQMIEDREKDKSRHEKSNLEILHERDQLHTDLNNTEKSFAHLHARFEKLKMAVEGYRKNEEILKKAVKDLQENLKKSEGKYQLLKKHAEEKIHEANVEITRVQTNNKAEVVALQAALKRERAKNSSLQQNLDQKINENRELTAICDELISKVGPIPQ